MQKPHIDPGLLPGVLSYVLWGLLPLYLVLLPPATSWEVAGFRMFWTHIFCLVVLVWRHDWAWLAGLIRTPKTLLGLISAAGCLSVNWGVYVYAVATHRAADGALGYFLNPLVSVALGVLVLGERLRRAQWLAVMIAVVAGSYLVLTTGGIPWIALVLSSAFAIYGLIKKHTQIELAPMPALWLESAFMLPVALSLFAWLLADGRFVWPTAGWVHTLLIMGLGPITAVPLLLFARATQTLKLATIGMLQFIAPTLQLLIAVWVFHEPVSAHKWLSFALVWVSLGLLTWDAVARQSRGLGGGSNRQADQVDTRLDPGH